MLLIVREGGEPGRRFHSAASSHKFAALAVPATYIQVVVAGFSFFLLYVYGVDSTRLRAYVSLAYSLFHFSLLFSTALCGLPPCLLLLLLLRRTAVKPPDARF